MKEIRHLLAELKNYPTNLFICVDEEIPTDDVLSLMTGAGVLGLVITDHTGKRVTGQSFIPIGGRDGEVKP